MAKHVKKGRKRPHSAHQFPASKIPKRTGAVNTAVSLAGLGAACGVSKITAFRWVHRADWPFGGKGPWDTKAVRAWARRNLHPDPAAAHRRERSIGPPLGDSTPIAKADLLIKLRRSKILELDCLERQNRLHDVEVCRQRRLRQVQEVKAALLDLHRKMEPEIGGAAADRLLGLCMDILKRFSNGHFAPAGPRAPAPAAGEDDEAADEVSATAREGIGS